jgi:hypothetical protein
MDGPLAAPEHDRTFMGRFTRQLFFAPIPRAGTPGDWVLVGLEQVPPDEPWPGQIEYVTTDEIEPYETAGQDQGLAIFKLREDTAE